MGAAFEQRQRAAADEIDLEAEQHVVGARRLDERLRLGADAEQARDEAADVRRHRHDQVAARDRTERARRLRDAVPTAPTAPAPSTSHRPTNCR